MNFLKKSSAPCDEARCIIQNVEDRFNGKDIESIQVEYPIHQRLMKQFDKLFANENKMSVSSKKMIGIIPVLSDFDIKMTHSANELMDFARNMSALSESNLAIVEEITESMNDVNETILYTSNTIYQLSKASQWLIQKNDESMVQLN